MEYADSQSVDCAVSELKESMLEGRRIFVRKVGGAREGGAELHW